MIGNNIFKFKQLDSTNTFIRNNISKLRSGDIVVSKSQSKGKGRYNNKWISEEGNLYFSFLLKEKINRSEVFSLIIKSSLSIVRLLQSYNVQANIKYPNDVVVNNKKISGILIESIGYNSIDQTIVGIGINVNQNNFGDINEKTTSIIKETKVKYKVEEVLQDFIKIYNAINENTKIFSEYIKKSVVIGKIITYKDKLYTIVEIVKNGNIILKNSNEELLVESNDISLADLY